MKWLSHVLGLGASPAPQVDASPKDGDALYALGIAAEEGRRSDEAMAFFRRAVAAQPENAEFRCALGATHFRYGRAQEAVANFRAGLAIDPGHEQMRLNLASALLVMEDYESALAELEQLDAQGSLLPGLHATLGYVQCQLGRNRAGLQTLRRALALRPDDAEAHRNLLLAMNYSAELGVAEIAAEHRRFGHRHEQPVGTAPVDAAWPRRLRIGYVSPDFRSHVVASFMWPILARHDRERFEVHCYYTNKIVDEATEGLRALAEHWADCGTLSEKELAARIRSDRIDILVDLAGHTGKSRLGSFALRPAPVQVTYLGYPNTTGLRALDYRITDARADPPGESDALHVERLIRLPKTFLCYRPGPDVVPVAPLPATRAGAVTFGCFNNFQKLSEPFFDAAARVLSAVPESRLLLKAKPLGLRTIADEVRSGFLRRGIDARRLELRGWEADALGHLAAYNEVDIALDSFPYNGTTTSCEAMWIGVPVVTLHGDRHAARVGASLLHALGLDDFIARDADNFVGMAARLAGDLPRLASLRAGMRERMRASPLMDESGFVRDLERAYLEVWQAKLAAVAPVPQDAQQLEKLWNRCHETGDHAAAIEALGSAIAADGGVARFHYMLGCTLQDAGRMQKAAEAYRKALALEPQLARAQNNLGCVLEAAGDWEGAMQCYEAALGAEPGLANALYNRGNMHKLQGDAAQAAADIGRALELEPEHPVWRGALGEAQILLGRPDAASVNLRAVLAADPADARARFGLGNALVLLGRADEAESCFRRALEDEPGFSAAHSNLLLCLHYRKGGDAGLMYEAHLEWARRHAGGFANAGTVAGIDAKAERPLNVGYVSPNFHAHSVISFIEPLLAAHDRGAVRVFGYSDVAIPDAVTQRLRGLCDVWRDIHKLGHDEAAQQIRQDRIDILVDLAGHTGGGRPLLFARRPAPVQVTWLGYPNTTGLAQMNYRVTDAWADPEGEADRHHTEKLVRLAGGFLCYAPPADTPEPGAPPVLESRRITFGSFNNLAKLTPEMVDLWGRILGALPQSRLVMKAHALGEESARRALLAQLARAGIEAERVALHGADSSVRRHLARYADVDIALDTFPYNGTTTSFEALWMGVPVVSLAGKTHASRVGASILTRAGLPELLAATPEEYASKAIALASNVPRLGELRGALRGRMRARGLLDAPGFARSLEASYREMWQRRRSPESPAQPAGRAPVEAAAMSAGRLRLNVGGTEKKSGWKIFNIQPGADVDYVGDCTDLRQFPDGTVDEIYASHVLEHVAYDVPLRRALAEFHRVLRPGGSASISVPDFEILCRLFLDARATARDRFHIMRMAFGGQTDANDFHHVGLTYEILSKYLTQAGFSRVERVEEFGLFHDDSSIEFLGQKISLNVVAHW